MPGAVAPRRLQAADIGEIYRRAFPQHRFIVVSNREPYEHFWEETAEAIAVRRPAGGVVAAVDPLMQAVGGSWIVNDRFADAVIAGVTTAAAASAAAWFQDFHLALAPARVRARRPYLTLAVNPYDLDDFAVALRDVMRLTESDQWRRVR